MVFLELQKCFGSDATVGGIKFQFATRIKADIELIKNARAKSIDCKDIKLSWADQPSIGGKGSKDTQFCFAFCFVLPNLLLPLRKPEAIHIDDSIEISSIMGSDTTPNGIKFQFTDRIRPIAKRQFDMRAAGLDPKDVRLDRAKGKGSQGQNSF